MTRRQLADPILLRRIEQALNRVLFDLRCIVKHRAEVYLVVDYFILYHFCRGLFDAHKHPLWEAIKYVFDRSKGRLVFLPPSVEEMDRNLRSEVRLWFSVPDEREIEKLLKDRKAKEFRQLYRSLADDKQLRRPTSRDCFRAFRELCMSHGKTIEALSRLHESEDLFGKPCRELEDLLCNRGWFVQLKNIAEIWGLRTIGIDKIYSPVLHDLNGMRASRIASNPTDASVYAMTAWLNKKLSSKGMLFVNFTEGFVKDILGLHRVETGFGSGKITLARDISTAFMFYRAQEVYGELCSTKLNEMRQSVSKLRAAASQNRKMARPSDHEEETTKDLRTALERELRRPVFSDYLGKAGCIWSWSSFSCTQKEEIEDTSRPYQKAWTRIRVAISILNELEDANISEYLKDKTAERNDLLTLMQGVYDTITREASYEQWSTIVRTLDKQEKEAVESARRNGLPPTRGDGFWQFMEAKLERTDAADTSWFEEAFGRWSSLLSDEADDALDKLRSEMRVLAADENFSRAAQVQALLHYLGEPRLVD